MTTNDKSSIGGRKVAVIFIGNAGAGKSTLLCQIGGDFKSGAMFRSGYTKDVAEKVVKLGDENVVLIDVPGLFEPSDKNTQENAKKLTHALKKGYDYKIFFVMKAGNNGAGDADVRMMAEVDKCVRQVDGSKVMFRVFINQIMEQRVHDMYQEKVAKDNFQGFFSSLDDNEPKIDINIDRVILLPFSEDDIRHGRLKETIAREVESHCAVKLKVKDICQREVQKKALSNRDQAKKTSSTQSYFGHFCNWFKLHPDRDVGSEPSLDSGNSTTHTSANPENQTMDVTDQNRADPVPRFSPGGASYASNRPPSNPVEVREVPNGDGKIGSLSKTTISNASSKGSEAMQEREE
ncbi:hypothetical protein BGX26_009465 [Mortierella sp. AD094]|nr:hypothetical protein BGX26_009465 [Mortierella sp. AD094]